MEIDQQPDRPKLGYLPKGASSTVLVVTSDSGVLSFLTFHYEESIPGAAEHGLFHVLKEIVIAEPGFDYSQAGAKIAIDPTSRIMAVSALQNLIKLVVIKSTKRSQFDPVERISEIDIKGTIIGMDFLTPEPDDKTDVAILAVLFHNKDTSRYHIATFHIGLQNRLTSPLSIQVGTSQLGTNPLKSVVLLKALPNIPRSMVYIDEEKITLVTVEAPTDSGTANTARHTHHSPLQLLKREPSEVPTEGVTSPSIGDVYPLISACATPPPSPYAASDQTLYLGSDTSELYRINIQQLTYAMQFELVTGDKPVGNVMQVLARRQFTTQPLLSEMSHDIILNTDYLIYSSDYGDGGVLGIKEEEEGIDLFAITELQNSSPILDFCVREPLLPGRDSLYACSGMRGEGTVKRVRYGISVESSGSSGNEFFSGATGLWSVKENRKHAFDSFLVVSFIQSTKVMRIEDGGARHVWQSYDGVIVSACLVKEGTLALGQISSGASSLVVLELAQEEAVVGAQTLTHSLKIIASGSLKAEPTTIHCWAQDSGSEESMEVDVNLSDFFCCVGTLEPAVLVFQITADDIHEIYSESLTQAGVESVTIPHSICLLRGRDGRGKVVVGLRDGSVVAYEWNRPCKEGASAALVSSRVLSSPRLFKIGIRPVKCAFSDNVLSRALILSDELWLAKFDLDIEIEPVLFDSEVTQACSFESGDDNQLSKPGFVFIVDHHDIQLVTLEGIAKYNHQTLVLGQTPRRILDITSKELLLVASVGDGFPFAESTLQLIDPDRVSTEAGAEKQHIVAEFALKQGEAVYCLAEWKIPRPNKSEAVYICIGTGLFSPTGSEVSAAAPKTGRLVVLSVKQSKKADRKSRKFELDLRWAMAMPAPVFAVSTFMDMKLLISTGPVLKLLALDLEKKTLVEKASHRERWPIIQISNHGSMVCTGSRRESISFYEYQPGTGSERSSDKLQFLKSARSARVVSDCIAVSPEFAIGVDMSGGIFGVGYSRDGPSCQNTLVDRFSFHLGEVMNRIRIAKIWPADVRSLAGIPLSQHAVDKDATSDTAERTGFTLSTQLDRAASNRNGNRSRPSLGQMASWTLLPWTIPGQKLSSSALTQSTQSSSTTPLVSSQALVACTLIGSIVGFWRLHPQVYQILNSLQSIMQNIHECRPVLGNLHDRYRSLSSPGLYTIDGDMVNKFLHLDHALQMRIVGKALHSIDDIVTEWRRRFQNRVHCGLSYPSAFDTRPGAV
ncbi:hypothetical protein BGX26_003118 [Mortierella sp. AD094]|nr:hypothetical protein BGX26_003118 [Mortierella sp. AD094]